MGHQSASKIKFLNCRLNNSNVLVARSGEHCMSFYYVHTTNYLYSTNLVGQRSLAAVTTHRNLFESLDLMKPFYQIFIGMLKRFGDSYSIHCG